MTLPPSHLSSSINPSQAHSLGCLSWTQPLLPLSLLQAALSLCKLSRPWGWTTWQPHKQILKIQPRGVTADGKAKGFVFTHVFINPFNYFYWIPGIENTPNSQAEACSCSSEEGTDSDMKKDNSMGSVWVSAPTRRYECSEGSWGGWAGGMGASGTGNTTNQHQRQEGAGVFTEYTQRSMTGTYCVGTNGNPPKLFCWLVSNHPSSHSGGIIGDTAQPLLT